MGTFNNNTNTEKVKHMTDSFPPPNPQSDVKPKVPTFVWALLGCLAFIAGIFFWNSLDDGDDPYIPDTVENVSNGIDYTQTYEIFDNAYYNVLDYNQQVSVCEWFYSIPEATAIRIEEMDYGAELNDEAIIDFYENNC